MLGILFLLNARNLADQGALLVSLGVRLQVGITSTVQKHVRNKRLVPVVVLRPNKINACQWQ